MPNVEGAILKDYKVALTLNDGQKVNSYFSTCFSYVNYTQPTTYVVGWDANTDLAVASGLEIYSNFGGYRVNAELEARPNVWLVGILEQFISYKLEYL
jgi:programmed cell death 8 (apoptosis-inducing factor)